MRETVKAPKVFPFFFYYYLALRGKHTLFPITNELEMSGVAKRTTNTTNLKVVNFQVIDILNINPSINQIDILCAV